MKLSKKYLSLVAAAVTSLGMISGNAAFGDLVVGPEQDFLTPSSPSSINITISIHSQFRTLTDDITIIFRSLTANAAAVGYIETTTDPNQYLVTTIYGDDLTQPGGPLTVGGLDPLTPSYEILGGNQGERIYGMDGSVSTSYLRESPTKQSLGIAHPSWDLSPFADSSNSFIAFSTLIPVSAVPEPATLTLLAGGTGLLALRRRRQS